MRFLKQFCIILLVSAMGELLKFFLPLPIPASVYGLVLMLFALITGIIKKEQIAETARFLIEIMPVMFIPAAVGLLTSWNELKTMLLPVTIIIIFTTVIVMGITGHVAQFIIRRQRGKKI